MIESETLSTAVKVAPPVVVSSGHFLGISWEQWVFILTAIYTLLQIGDWVWNKVKSYKEGRNVNP
ncbi:holin [Lelliottia phage phD2B]|uniref:Putative holin n=1 Tax=Lelliottia phage phD2B TaxID=1542498 RepID=A0A088FT74_9CAUD|nr:holin [Lelliottia phage phD2B]AIM51265.1 putative holin [Lelliottia phage phD2B]